MKSKPVFYKASNNASFGAMLSIRGQKPVIRYLFTCRESLNIYLNKFLQKETIENMSLGNFYSKIKLTSGSRRKHSNISAVVDFKL